MAGNILSVDIGTSSLKAAFIDFDGKLHAFIRESYGQEASFSLHAEAWLKAFIFALKKLNTFAPEFSPDAICISGNGPTLVPVMGNGETLPPLCWNSGKIVLSREGLEVSQAHPVPESGAEPSFFLPHVAWFKKKSPQEYSKVKVFISSHEWLSGRLGAQPYTSLPSSAYKPYYWDDEQCSLYGMEKEKFPPFLNMGSVAGQLSQEAVSLLSVNRCLQSGIPIIAGGPDFITALVGTNTGKPGDVCDRTGSSEGINVCASGPVAAEGLRVLPHAREGLWNISVVIPSAGKLFDEYLKETRQQNRSYSEILTELIPSSFLIKQSEMNKGRAVLCTMGYNVHLALETLKHAGFEVSVMRLSGSQAKNARWNQFKADITGVTLEVPEIPDGELAGNAVIAAASLEGISRDEAADKMIRIRDVYRPGNKDFWKERYRNLQK